MRFPRLHLQLLPAVVLPLLLAACTTTNAGLRPMQHGLAAAVRPPTPGERARIVVAVNETWKYESEPTRVFARTSSASAFRAPTPGFQAPSSSSEMPAAGDGARPQ